MTMESPNKKTIRNLSIKLCTLIEDGRPVQEIKVLVEKGANINFRDANRDQCSPLHLAVLENYVECAELLLKLNSDLSIENADGETAEDLAKKCKSENILKLIAESKEQENDEDYDSIDEKFIHEFSYEEFSSQSLSRLKNDLNFKILKITDCPSVKQVFDKIQDPTCKALLKDLTHFFVLIIQTQGSLGGYMWPKLDNDRPLIIQLTGKEEKPKIFYKEAANVNCADFNYEEVIFPDKLEEDFLAKFNSKENANFSRLIQGFHLKIFGKFKGNLLETKLKKGDVKSNVTKLCVSYTALGVRFLKLFKIKSESSANNSGESSTKSSDISSSESLSESSEIIQLKNSLNCDVKQVLSALLDASFKIQERDLTLLVLEHFKADKARDNGLLKLLVAQNNVDALKFLLKCGFNLNLPVENETIADVAWRLQHHDCLAELIANDSPFPKDFSIENNRSIEPSFSRLKSKVENQTAIHKDIKDGKLEEVRKYVKKQQHIKFAYDHFNNSALTVALQQKQFEIYSLLLSQGLSPGIDEKFDEAVKSLSSEEKKVIQEMKKKMFKTQDCDHLVHLMRKSKLTANSNDAEKTFGIIRQIFIDLNEIEPEIRSILKLLAQSDELHIVFDFYRKTQSEVEPLSSVSNMNTLTHYKNGYIYVAAANHTTSHAMSTIHGILAHKLVHHALQLLYHNDCKPYEQIDMERSKNYQDMLKTLNDAYKDSPDKTDPIVCNTFKNFPTLWHQTFAAQVAFFLAKYNKEKTALRNVKLSNCKDLFAFFNEKVMKDIAKVVPEEKESILEGSLQDVHKAIFIDETKVLGTGALETKVFQGTYDKRTVAVKRLLETHFKFANSEIESLRKFDHQNVIRYFFNESKSGFIYIAIDLCLASLNDIIKNRNNIEMFKEHSKTRGIPVEDFLDALNVNNKVILYQATKGLNYLHSKDFIHQDVKPQNILISLPQTGKVKHKFIVKISDFGLCREIREGRESITNTGIAGTQGWLAPEALQDDPAYRKTKALDMFSMGCVFYYVLAGGKHIFGDRYERTGNIYKNRRDMKEIERLDNESILAHSLISDMISPDPSKRPAASDVLDHPFFWKQEKNLQFLQEVSDRIFKEHPSSDVQRLFEESESLVVKGDWLEYMEGIIRQYLKDQKYCTYRGESMKDLLRALRNTKHHFNELPQNVKEYFDGDTRKLVKYWIDAFPHLLTASYHAMDSCKEEKIFEPFYSKKFNFTRPDFKGNTSSAPSTPSPLTPTSSAQTPPTSASSTPSIDHELFSKFQQFEQFKKLVTQSSSPSP